MFAIQVVFNERGYWSKPYTYLYNNTIEKGKAVVVPTGKYYGVGKVVESFDKYKFDPQIKYRHIIAIIEGLE